MRNVMRGLVGLFLPGTILFATQAGASGMIALPEQREDLASFAACLARLETAERDGRAAVSPLVIAQDGATREITLQSNTNGVERTGGSVARYHQRLWFHTGRPAGHDRLQREVSHSWEEQDMRCDGAALTIAGASGYTLSTFEPLANDPPRDPA